MSAKERIHALVEEKKDLFISASDKIWGFAEMGMKEFQSSKTLMDTLSAEGFTVESGLADIPTAFCASFGSGKPVIGFLGEFDALPNLSQVAGLPEQKELEPDANGHGCGHNLLGTASLAAAVALKDYLTENNLSGTVKYFGCPGEEFGCGKAFMSRAGCFDGLDCALTWHPGPMNMTVSCSMLANLSVYFSFHGRTSHAAAAPHLGRSALDAAELMNVGVNFLREHIIPEARVHYAFHDVGGIAPNVVQDRSKLHYYIRAPKKAQVQEIYERVCKVAQGAAMMTETECTITIKDGLSDYIPNQTITKVMSEAMLELGPIPFNEADYALAERFHDTIHGAAEPNPALGGKTLMAQSMPYRLIDYCAPASSDVGDVSYVVPTAQFTAATCCLDTVPHTWQMTAQGHTDAAHKGLLFAGKAMAFTAVKLLENPAILEEAKEEFLQSTKGAKYHALFPDDVMPDLD